MAATNKCLAQNNKSGMQAKAIVYSIMSGDIGGTYAVQQLVERADSGDPLAIVQLRLIRRKLRKQEGV
jgi:hypothetical protein